MPHQASSSDYERLARLADERLAFYARQSIEEAVKLAHLSGTEIVLDACCGTGELLQRIALTGHRGSMTGVDFSPTMLNVAASRLRQYEQISLKVGDVRHLDLPSAYYHLVFNTSAFHYFTEPAEVLREISRVLRPHGRLILTDLAANSRLTRLWSWLRRYLRPVHHHVYQPGELKNLLREAGFKVVHKKIWKVNFFWSVMLFEAQKPAPASREVSS